MTFSFFERYAKPKPRETKLRPIGRPKTRTQEHYAALIQQHAEISVWFLATFNRPHKSDKELLTAHLEHEFTAHGYRALRVSEQSMASKLKTMLNELSSARQLFPQSRKGAIQGKASQR